MRKTDNKILTAYRLHPDDIEQLIKVSEKTGLTKTKIVERSLARYFDDIANGKPA